MMRYIITQADIDAARTARACENRLNLYHVGDDLFDKLTYTDAVWIEDKLPDSAKTILNAFSVPLYAMARDGCGDGFGYGDGSGFGFGYGYSSGSGFGSGFGYGYSDGSGDGFGHGYGSGDN